ncbi:RNA polymerase sigma-70 factor, ECF subfamily [Flavobacteriaceae bacterium MAR_2010_188]|nr:RNA polymerase sigma-70 factor, ECF subfamily [Flavobacteriaceae bacterium MAR_2010_188]
MEKEFLDIVTANQKIIYKVSRLYRDSKEDQEDLFQEIVYQLWNAYPKFRNDSKVTTWMYRIALNTAIATFRKKKVEIDFKDNIPYSQLPIDDSQISENEILMYEALKKLNSAERAIISLFLEDYSYKEIGELVGITENYVGVKMSRIKEKLKTILKK